ncbi:hypothetical protein SBY92_001551 [Candida maltosa Xu316]|uniref:Uncharacterized protein n=1 Tax=Candida maltosa (strain Xu316) TaxID=1245528 RepID=M3K7B4_CANMX|nr:hypothetical protein G210_1249 [Candida maltosa Xu316]
MDSFIKQGKELYDSGKITNEDIKDVGAIFSKNDGGDIASKAKEAYSEYQENHKGDGQKKQDDSKQEEKK